METSFTEGTFTYSIPVDPAEIRKTGCFTLLPVRIHKYNDLADAASHKLRKDWQRHVRDGQDEKPPASPCEAGNLCAFVFPEALPERLGVLTYGMDLAFMHDDASEAVNFSVTMTEHSGFVAAPDARDIGKTQSEKKESGSMKPKKLAAQFLLESVNIDHDLGMHMLDAYHKDWAAVIENTDAGNIKSLDEYYDARRRDFGMVTLWAMAEFGMGFRLSDDDKELIKDVFRPAEEALILTNDYWSWDREYNAAKVNGDRLFNAVDVIAKTKSVPVEEARVWVGYQIGVLEQEYLEQKQRFFREKQNIPFYLRKWVELCGYTISGSHYWSSHCPRYHASHQVSSNGREQTAQVMPNVTSSSDFGDVKENSLSTTLTVGTAPPLQQDAENCQPGKATASGTISITKTSDTKGTNEGGAQDKDASKQRVSEARWNHLDEAALSAPCRYINSLPSKGVRTTLIESFNFWLHVPSGPLAVIENIIRLLHNASLILDDIEDGSPLRRGSAATHLIFGSAQAINSANFMFVEAVQAVQQLENPGAMDTLLEELKHLYLGQSWDLYWKYNLVCPHEGEYMGMVDHKTGGMFRMLLKLMVAESPLISTTVNFDKLTILFGRFFQIRDDYMNLQSRQYSSQKGFCEDLDEGKFSYPIVHCIEHCPNFKDQIIGLFRQRTLNSRPTSAMLSRESKMHILGCLTKSGAFEATKKKLQEIEAELETEITKIEDTTGETNPMMRLLLKKLTVRDTVKRRGGIAELGQI
ncbi:hypothetical protein GP486_003894 [Trichoglossum hirsutum]|uniref:Uncharacterized protein n=1 Tax=Trichoglossum hirsutum TaxID=265104 RepID=A0A9P8RQJ2_9PEZI|nr:hypothetical protein GP486_003894 [Trichoglossum hirsutum]